MQSRSRPTEAVEIELSFRLNPVGPPCCYVYAREIKTDGQHALLDSRHLTGPPEFLVDQVDRYCRDLIIEHFLTRTSPF